MTYLKCGQTQRQISVKDDQVFWGAVRMGFPIMPIHDTEIQRAFPSHTTWQPLEAIPLENDCVVIAQCVIDNDNVIHPFRPLWVIGLSDFGIDFNRITKRWDDPAWEW